MAYTGADAVMSAEGLLQDPGLFGPERLTPQGAHTQLSGLALAREYLHLVDTHPAPMRMVKVRAGARAGEELGGELRCAAWPGGWAGSAARPSPRALGPAPRPGPPAQDDP